jgi:hypothetical protein
MLVVVGRSLLLLRLVFLLN